MYTWSCRTNKLRANHHMLPSHFTAILSIVFSLHLYVLYGDSKGRNEIVLEFFFFFFKVRAKVFFTLGDSKLSEKCMCNCVLIWEVLFVFLS